MPPETPIFDRSLAEASETLAAAWIAGDQRSQDYPHDTDIKTWSSNQIACFLDALLSAKTPLKLGTIKLMNDAYGFACSKNSEILHRYCQLAIAAGKFFWGDCRPI
jgi:hypothetical protein